MSPDPLRKILFITADQWRGECLSKHGHPVVKTPNLDRLAADGVSFRSHYTQSCPCGPARTSLLTGLYAMNHRSVLNGTPLDARHSNLALEVRKAGYDPILFGFTDTSLDPRGRAPRDPALLGYQGVMPGFSIGCELHEGNLYSWLSQLKAKGYPLPADPFAIYLPVDEYPAQQGRGHSYPPPIYKAEDSDTAFIADKVLDYIDLRRHQSWFIHAVFLRPHPPLFAPEPYNAMYDPDMLQGPVRAHSREQEERQHPLLTYWLETQGIAGAYMGHELNVRDLPDYEIRQMRASYYGLMSEVDAQLGRIIDHLQASGDYEQTLIIFSADHGEMLGDHWLFGKGGYFDPSYHIPLIIRDPRPETIRGQVITSFTEAVDIMPTILDWLGLQIPTACDGDSLLPFLRGAAPSNWRTEVHWEFDFRDPVHQHPEQALGIASDQCTLNVIRDRRYKYVHFTALPPLFFDLENDPHEFHNLAPEPAYQTLVLEYAQKLLSWRMNHAERTLSNTLLTPEGIVEHRGPRRLP